MKKGKLIVLTVIVFLLAFLVINETWVKNTEASMSLHSRIYSYMEPERNQEKVFETAIELNGKTSSNACVYFLAEVLRRNGVKVPKGTGNTNQILSILKEKGFKKYTDYKDLEPGDIVFTTDEKGNKNGIPSHTYVFMKWVEEGSYDYAYICDNQAKDYDNEIYHIRNIKNRDKVKGITKDAFSFFMRPE